ncbi:MAG TPA: Gfo/Idh/MocA family oxidoreductase [Candidatus Dormibacteraeota bacterium]|nr:Gfo/Idh/MocA family oxidoreductase [Candidatus Dormibacteraeota bacterium]
MTRVRVGVIGLGRVTQLMHLPHLRDLDDRFEIAGVCDVSPELTRLMAGRYHVPLATASYRDLLRAELDAVLVAVTVPPEDIVADALAARAHVFVEKPMAWTPAQARRLTAAAPAAGRVLMVGFMKRYDPAYRLAQRFVREMGQVRGGTVRCVLGPNDLFLRDLLRLAAPEVVDPDVERAGREAAASRLLEAIGEVPDELLGAYRGLLFLASHDLSMLRGLVGPPHEVSSTSVWHGGRWLSTTLRYEHFSLTYTMGTIATRHFEERVELYADTHTVRLTFPSPFLRHAPTIVTREYADGRRTAQESSVASYEEAFRLELEHFHDCIVGGGTPDTPAADASADIELMVAIIRAAASRRPQSVAVGG